MVKRQSSSLRPLAVAVGATVLLVVPVGVVLLRETEPTSDRKEQRASVAGSPDADPKASGIELAPPPPSERELRAMSTASRAPSSAFQTASAPPPEVKKPTKPASVRLVAIARLERKRPSETIGLAEDLVREIAGDPAERTVLLGALGVLHRVDGGEAALVRLSDDPPSAEVGRLAAEYLMRPKVQ